MKFTTSKKIDSALLGERVIREYSYTDSTGGSNDDMRRGYSYTVHCKIYGTIENETENEDGTYTYDYSSRVEKDDYQYGDGYRNPSESEYDLNEMVKELLFQYNIHEFSTDLQKEMNNIKDYYVSINTTSDYEKDNTPSLSYSYSIHKKDKKYYAEFNKPLEATSERITLESINDVNAQLNSTFSKEDYIKYLAGYKVEKNCYINLGLDEIGEDETVSNLLMRMSLESPKFSTFENALGEVIYMEDMKKWIPKNNYLNAKDIPNDTLEQLFREDQELISHFDERTIPIDILRKYSPNLDISKISPKDLIPSDLDSVLKQVISHSILGIYNGPSAEELKQGYLEYLQRFYDNPEALKKIIPAINTAKEYFFESRAPYFVSQISPEVLETNEIRDILLNTENITLYQLLLYNDLEYDTNSAKKLMQILSNTTSKTSLEYINSVIKILQQNGISNDEILQALRINGFNIYIGNKDKIHDFKKLGIEGITLDDVRDSILKSKDFKFMNLMKDFNPEEITREYNSLLNELSERNGKENEKDTEKYEEIFELMCHYSDSMELFSRLTPESKKTTKNMLIKNLDLVNEFSTAREWDKEDILRKILYVMENSFEMDENDLKTILIKTVNTGKKREDIISVIEQFLPEERKKVFGEEMKKANIYPNSANNRREVKMDIPLNKTIDRNTIKSKIQSDGRCFRIKITTDMVGESKDGKPIHVNNLSKWLFGVPGARGNMSVTRSGDRILLPWNTPQEAIELIEEIILEKEHIK